MATPGILSSRDREGYIIPRELMQIEIIKNPSFRHFMQLVREYNKYVLPARGPDWQVRGLYWQGDWFIWPGTFWTHQSASRELNIPYSWNAKAVEDGKAAVQLEFWYLNEEDDSLGEHIQVHFQLGSPVPRIPFLGGLGR